MQYEQLMDYYTNIANNGCEIIWLVHSDEYKLTFKEELKNRISQRTKIMLNSGLIDEVIFLEKKYTRAPNCMSSIGIVETLEYLDGKLTKQQLEEKISLNTAKLAKRQNTFNKGQFLDKTSNIIENLNSDIIKYFSL